MFPIKEVCSRVQKLSRSFFRCSLLMIVLFSSFFGYGLPKDNPMGKTWVIFIENSNYQSFPSISGPSQDVGLMKKSLESYKIDRIVHKKNMTKEQMEAFFSKQLKDLVRENKVQSLLVWYAGHGKYINEMGYWVPVNAIRDKETTYFKINALKTSMQLYSKDITHTLIVTDACESGPSFYQAMRDVSAEKECDSDASIRKSSQVFASSGYDLASNNSQFTQTFAKTLSNNGSSCIPVEKVVAEVTKMVIIKNRKRPKFGVIPGFEHKGGTFFFIKK